MSHRDLLRPLITSFAALGSVLAAPGAVAAVSSATAIAKPGGGQLGLAVAFTPEGQLRAAVCAAEPCTLDHAATIKVPDDAARAASGAKLQIVRIGADRHAIVVEIPEVVTQRTWAAVLAAPLAGTAKTP